MTTHVLMINPQLAFTVSLKQALERTGAFDVHPFTTADAAFDYLRDHPQDVALVDFNLPGVTGLDLVRQLRAIQPDLSIIASPQQPEDTAQFLHLQDTLNMPFTAREIIPRLNRAASARTSIPLDSDATPARGSLAQTKILLDTPYDPVVTRDVSGSQPPPLVETDDYDEVASERPGDTPEFSTFEQVVRQPDAPGSQTKDASTPGRPADPFHDLVKSLGGQEERKPLPERSQSLIDFTLPTDPERTRGLRAQVPESDTVFRRLADEEPPMPSMENSGTVGDLMTGVGDSGFRNVLALLRGEEPEPAPRTSESPETPKPTTLSDEELEAALAAFYEATEGEPEGGDPMLRDTVVSRAVTDEDAFRDFGGEEPADDEQTPARVVLETALDESTPPESFSLAELIRSIERKLPEHRPNVYPLPSWLSDWEPLIREPDFLPEELPPVTDSTGDFADQPTQPHVPQTIQPGDYETEYIEPSAITQPIAVPDIQPAKPELTPEPDAEEAPEPEWDVTPVPDVASEPVVETPSMLVDDPLALWDDTEGFEVEVLESVENAQADVTLDEPVSLDTDWPDAEVEGGRLITLENYELDPALFDTMFERFASFALIEDDEHTPSVGMAAVEDPVIAQLALSLTQLSLETTSEATLLTRGGEIVAFAGQLTREEIDELRAAVDDDWDTEIEEARIRFVTLSGTNREYMLYSRRTEDDYTLSMIFVGTTPIRDIRRQGKRIVEALRAVPEPPPPPPPVIAPPPPPPPVPMAALERRTEAPAPAQDTQPVAVAIAKPESSVLVAYACTWILRDAASRLSESTAQAIMSGLRTQLNERGWRVRNVHAQDEYVYLLGEVPESVPPKEVIRDLKRRSAEIARALDSSVRPDSYWADAYLMVTPGRELELDEIQQFISFERM